MDENETIEGFLCPICILDFKNPTLLTKHFEDNHSDDPEILKSLKDLFGKAKKKILKKDPIDYSEPIVIKTKPKVVELDLGPQDIGEIKSYTSYFKEVRNTKLERYSTETNKLLIRLDKLMNNLPQDPTQRKTHEQSIVPWMDDKDVKFCLSCGKSFNLARRKHHCRLCGAVVCHDCSIFLTLLEARKMTAAAIVQDDTILSPTSETLTFTDRLVQAGVGLTQLAKSPSSNNFNSVLSVLSDSNVNDQSLRICQYCKNLLDARERLKARHYSKPMVHQLYEKLHEHMTKADRRIEQFETMCYSLREGEPTYNLRDAQILRGEIAKIGDQIDFLSKKIMTLVSVDEESPASIKQEYKLNQMIRTAAAIFLKNKLLRIPTVPTEEEYNAIRKERQEKMLRKIEQEKIQLDREQNNKYKDLQSPEPVLQHSNSSTQLVLDQSQGWGTSGPTGNKMISSNSIDPFIEQMRNLKLYIKQAREECRFEEAIILETNLAELQSEYYAMQEVDGNVDFSA